MFVAEQYLNGIWPDGYYDAWSAKGTCAYTGRAHRLRDVHVVRGGEDLLDPVVADRRRVRERRRARDGRLHVLEREELLVVARGARPELDLVAVVRDVVLQARRPTCDGDALVGRVVEAVMRRERRGDEGMGAAYCVFPSCRQNDTVSSENGAPSSVVVRHLRVFLSARVQRE
jgi:hypothetical protein